MWAPLGTLFWEGCRVLRAFLGFPGSQGLGHCPRGSLVRAGGAQGKDSLTFSSPYHLRSPYSPGLFSGGPCFSLFRYLERFRGGCMC